MENMSFHMPCNGCKLRARAEANPNSFVAWFWRLHISVCPGWKNYQRAVKQEQEAALDLLYP